MASVRRRQRERRRRAPASPAILQRHLATLRLFRAVEPCAAFVWPEDVRTVHSVIDHTYGLEAKEVPETYLHACSRWEHHTDMLEQMQEDT